MKFRKMGWCFVYASGLTKQTVNKQHSYSRSSVSDFIQQQLKQYNTKQNNNNRSLLPHPSLMKENRSPFKRNVICWPVCVCFKAILGFIPFIHSNIYISRCCLHKLFYHNNEEPVPGRELGNATKTSRFWR